MLLNESGSVVAVFNGGIYDFQSLISKLQAAGHMCPTKYDTEVIVHAWEQWGEDFVKRFRAMLAFSLSDRNRQTLFLARDRLGVKPLYFALGYIADPRAVFRHALKLPLAHLLAKVRNIVSGDMPAVNLSHS